MEVAEMAVRLLDIRELLNKNKSFSTKPGKGEPFRIRVRYNSKVDYLTRKHVVEVLREKGFQQVGNTTSWVKASKNKELGRQTFLAEDKN